MSHLKFKKIKLVNKSNSHSQLPKAYQNEIHQLAPFPIPGSFNWELKNQNGKLAKRIKKFIWQEYKVDLVKQYPKQWAQLTQIISKGANKQGTNPDKVAYVDLSNELNWDAGEFGESSHSCWWPGNQYSQSPNNLFEVGGFAIRFYNEHKQGIARAMVIPLDDHYFVFNAYGITALEAAQQLADLLGYSHTDITEVYHNIPKNAIYINTKKVVAVGPKRYNDVFANFTSIYDWPIDEDSIMCDHCGCHLDVESEEYTIVEDNILCLDCHETITFNCPICSENFYNDYSVSTNQGAICESCASECALECEECENHIIVNVPKRSFIDPDDDYIVIGDNAYHTTCATKQDYCISCLDDRDKEALVCKDCEEDVPDRLYICLVCNDHLAGYGQLCLECATLSHHGTLL